MVVDDTISEKTAVKQAGVSARTLQRFSEAGYLTVRVTGDGERLYSRSQLHEIFGSFQEPPTANQIASSPAQSSASSEGAQETAKATTCSSDASTPTYYSEVEANPMVERVATETSQATPASTNALYEDYVRAKNLITLQERILDMKDSEISDLRSQRDWLRTRVEKLEEKGDRDQVLLLSETQALRQLISLQQKRPSTVRNILEWLGLSGSDSLRSLPPGETRAANDRGNDGATILVGKVANG